jgi:predicted porin
MKKQFLLIISISISALSFAQSNILFGARVGVSSAGIRGNAVNSLKSLLTSTNGMIATRNITGFFAGTYATIPVSNGIAIEPAVNYSQKGYEPRGALNVKGMDLAGANVKAQLQSQYIDMPILLKVNAGGLQLFAGPQLSYLLRADLRTSAGVLGINLLNRKIDATSQFNRWDAAVTGGIGYQFSKGISLMASYDYGLSKLDANKAVDSYNDVVKVGVGIQF